MRPSILLIAMAVIGFAGRCEAKVVASAAHGFTLTVKQEVTASSTECYRALLDIGSWWAPSHSYSGKAENLYLEAKKGGWFGERLPKGGFVRHLEVAYLEPGKAIRMLGGLGPLQQMGVSGALTIQIESEGEGAVIQLTYAVSGFAPSGLDKIAPAVDQVLTQQMKRLAAAAERKKQDAKREP